MLDRTQYMIWKEIEGNGKTGVSWQPKPGSGMVPDNDDILSALQATLFECSA